MERVKTIEYGCMYTINSKRLSETVVVYESDRKPGFRVQVLFGERIDIIDAVVVKNWGNIGALL